jgi:hypothetical protein
MARPRVSQVEPVPSCVPPTKDQGFPRDPAPERGRGSLLATALKGRTTLTRCYCSVGLRFPLASKPRT